MTHSISTLKLILQNTKSAYPMWTLMISFPIRSRKLIDSGKFTHVSVHVKLLETA